MGVGERFYAKAPSSRATRKPRLATAPKHGVTYAHVTDARLHLMNASSRITTELLFFPCSSKCSMLMTPTLLIEPCPSFLILFPSHYPTTLRDCVRLAIPSCVTYLSTLATANLLLATVHSCSSISLITLVVLTSRVSHIRPARSRSRRWSHVLMKTSAVGGTRHRQATIGGTADGRIILCTHARRSCLSILSIQADRVRCVSSTERGDRHSAAAAVKRTFLLKTLCFLAR